MKNLIYILLIISQFGLITIVGNHGDQTNASLTEHHISDFHNTSINNIITGGTFRNKNLINLFYIMDLFADLVRNTEFQNQISAGRSHRQSFGWSYSLGLKGGETKMASFPRMSNSELKKSRIEYYAAKRRVDSLENKVNDFNKIIDTGKRQKVKVDKVTREKTIVTEKLTDVQIKDTKRKLVAAEFQLLVAKDELKKKDFGFSQATGAISDKINDSKQAYKTKKTEEKLESVKALVNSAVMNGNLQSVVDLQNLTANGGDFKQIKSDLMKIVRKENKNGYPIKNLAHKTVEIIMAGLLSWNSDKAEQPFPIS